MPNPAIFLKIVCIRSEPRSGLLFRSFGAHQLASAFLLALPGYVKQISKTIPDQPEH